MQAETASSETTTKPQPVITDDAVTLPRQQKQSQPSLIIRQNGTQEAL